MHNTNSWLLVTYPPMQQSSNVADNDSLVEVNGTELAESDAYVLVEIHLYE